MILADFNLVWPILILWVVAVLFGKKKRPAARSTGASLESTESVRESGAPMGQLARALAELKAAEQVATRPPQRPRPAAESDEEVRARAYPDARKAAANRLMKQQPTREVFYPKKPARPSVTRRPVLEFEDDDADKTSEDETVVSLEGAGYDDQAAAIIEARRRWADREVAPEVSNEELSSEQTARRAVVEEGAAIGGRVEHQAWHEKVAAAEARVERRVTAAKPGKLARFATGRPGDAVVLSEILGRPVGDR
ncbi:MAG: hypothetical protein Q8Q85_03400 [Gemmatimonadales bacterium]|nr:hypothetical protein [Gemmatimonadales bacterium]